MIDYEYADLFYGSHAKTWIFTCIDPDVQLTFSNDDIVQESISLERGMCETDFFAYGTYSSNSIRVSVFKTEEQFKGKRFLVDVVLDNHTEAPLTVGTFTCESDNLSSDRRSRELVMYDDLYKLSELDVASWYNHFFDTDEPVYMVQFRTSFFEECLHIDYELADSQGTALSADFMQIKKAANYRTLMASTVLKSILVVNCVNGMMTNINKFRFVRIKEYDIHLEPPFSHWDIIPDIVLDNSKFYNCNYEEYQVLYVDGMRVTIDPDHVIFIVIPTYDLPDVDNTLDISYDNMFFRGIETSEITSMLTANYEKIHRRISFTPARIQLRGNLCYEPGDVVQVDIDGKTIYTVIVKQTITGVQGLTMTLSCQGDERFSNPLSVESASYDDYAGSDPSSTGSSVVANPDEDATDELTKIKINGTVYDVAGGGTSTAYVTQNVVSREIQQNEVTVVQTSFNTNKGTSAIFNGQALITSSADSVVTVKYYLNNELEDYIGEQTLVASGTTMLPLYKNFPALDPDTTYALKVTMTSSAGTVTLNALNLHGSIICYNLSEMQGVVTASDVAVAHTSYEGTDDVIWVAYIENGLLKVKFATDSDPIVWASHDIPRITGARAISMAFNSNIEGNYSYHEFVTTPRPFIAYIKGQAIYLLDLTDNSNTLIVSGNVTDVSLVRAPKFIQAGTDFGFAMFFLMENQLYYKQLIDGVWYDAEVIELTYPEGTIFKSIEAFITWDFRVGVLITTTSGEMSQLISYFEGLSNLMNEHIEFSMTASLQMSEILHHTTKNPDEHIAVTLMSSISVLWGHTSLPVSIENTSGTTIQVAFDYPVTTGTATSAMFTLQDSNGVFYTCEGVTTNNGILVLTFEAFDLAAYATNITLTYTQPSSGGLMSPAVPVETFSQTFVPVGLNPPQINPPAVVSVVNDSAGETLTVTFDEDITNTDFSGVLSHFGVSLSEYKYTPNGPLQSTTRTVTEITKVSSTVLRMTLSTPNISSAVGDVTLSYDGLGGLRGYGGPASAFAENFTPVGLTWKGHQNEEEHIALRGSMQMTISQIQHYTAKNPDEHIALGMSATITITDIHEIG